MADATLTQENVIGALKNVYDPEIPVNVVDLGLIYEVQINEGNVYVQMTLTAPGCGMGPQIAQQAEWAVADLDGIEDVQVEMVFDPPLESRPDYRRRQEATRSGLVQGLLAIDDNTAGKGQTRSDQEVLAAEASGYPTP